MWQTVMPMPQRIFSSLQGQGMAFRSQRTPMGAAFPEKPLRLRMGSCHKPLTGIAPGEVALINMLIPGDIPHGLPLSTGVLVLYADEESFTFMNPEGHMFAGWITFSAYEEDGCTVAQIELLVRANDPAYELGFRLGGSRSENKFWQYTLAAMAAHFGVVEPVQTHVVCIDPGVQWSQFWNIWQNAAIRTFLYRMLTPVRWMLKYVSRGASTKRAQ